MSPSVFGLSLLSAIVAFVAAPFRHRPTVGGDSVPLREFRRRKNAGLFVTTIDGDLITIRDPEVGCHVTIDLAQREHLHEVFRGTWLRAWVTGGVKCPTS
jgi:hypothetical protein